jgi:cytochrome b involved in lipid metabolism
MEEYTIKQVAEHNSPEDAWLIIHGQGELSSFIPKDGLKQLLTLT